MDPPNYAHATLHGKGGERPEELNVLTPLVFRWGILDYSSYCIKSQAALNAGEEGWRDSVMVNGSNYSCKGPRFSL